MRPDRKLRRAAGPAPGLAIAALLCLGATTACSGRGETGAAPSLFADRQALDVLSEQGALGGPRSEGPNRLFGGWVPVTIGSRERLRTLGYLN